MSEVDKALLDINPIDILTSGKITKKDIGKTVYLSNSTIECQEWRIADINHDDTKNTVDLFSKYTLTSSGSIFDGRAQWAGPRNDYKGSPLQSYVDSTIDGFATEIKGALKQYKERVDINGLKIKIPSLSEIGLCGGDISQATGIDVSELGSIYPIFGSEQLVSNSLSIYTTANKNITGYWTCSDMRINSYVVYYVNGNGNRVAANISSSCCVVGIIRF